MSTEVQRPQFIISGNLNVTLILDGQTHSIGPNHPNHDHVLNAIREESWDLLPDLVDVPRAVKTYTEGNIVVNEFGEVTYGGEPIHNVIAERIAMFFKHELDYRPLVAFLDNLMENPSRRAVEELYPFLENEGMALTEDGCFVGYKSVREDFMDIHSGKFDNKVGAVHEMPRNLVDDDARKDCSNGFHIGSQRYASGFGSCNGHMMLVKVNPRDAVSVPYADAGKLRACRYEVLREIDRSTIIVEPLYMDPTPEPEPDEVLEDFDDLDDQDEGFYDDDDDDDFGDGYHSHSACWR